MYMKVAIIGGLIIASPWVFYQLWLFVGAGLYPHERRYIYIYLPVSIGLFLGGAAFCFYVAMPVVLDFLLGYNRSLGFTPQIRISEWVSFVITLPLMFGLSFQLPVVMLFLERISIMSVETYRANRKIAVLVISIAAMVLTPTQEPGSMMLMFVPLVLLYEVGILMCSWHANPLRETPAT
jgi:sec-independent protein translocase protein TatC